MEFSAGMAKVGDFRGSSYKELLFLGLKSRSGSNLPKFRY